ncbi:ANR family transcriptional regulator [Lonepinella koalarum]|uniref:ANR family transcriptional regulator n=1 Tax=Lonepinella koalarum TaxID=53417 RepID=UPI003F6DB36F
MATFIENQERYRHWSEKASDAEKQGDYRTAAEAWNTALLCASVRNQAWCRDRREFCERMMKRPFRGE